MGTGDIGNYSDTNLKFKEPEDQHLMDLFQDTIARSSDILRGPKAPLDATRSTVKQSVPKVVLSEKSRLDVGNNIDVDLSDVLGPVPDVLVDYGKSSITAIDYENRTVTLGKPQRQEPFKGSVTQCGPNGPYTDEDVKNYNPSEWVKRSSTDVSLIAMLTALLSIYMPPDQFKSNPIVSDAYKRLG